eukprot:2117515-Lingulodinium_polyedra.AAC.1
MLASARSAPNLGGRRLRKLAAASLKSKGVSRRNHAPGALLQRKSSPSPSPTGSAQKATPPGRERARKGTSLRNGSTLRRLERHAWRTETAAKRRRSLRARKPKPPLRPSKD